MYSELNHMSEIKLNTGHRAREEGTKEGQLCACEEGNGTWFGVTGGVPQSSLLC